MSSIQSTADRSLLELLAVAGAYTFPAARDETEELALQHANTLVERGLARELAADEGQGPSYEITDAGRAAIRRFQE